MGIRNAVIVLNYNDADRAIQMVTEIAGCRCIDKIIIVDNCSSDDSYEKLTAIRDDKTDVIRTKRNGGYAYGNNRGCAYAIKKYQPQILTIANPDVSFKENVLESMLRLVETRPDCGAVGCMMKCHSSIRLPAAWKMQTYTDCLLENLILLKRVVGDPKLYRKDYFSEDVVKVDVVAGSLFCIRADVFEKCGKYDENTFLYYEESILAQKLKEKGYQSYLLTTGYYDHYHSATIDKEFKTKKKRLDLSYKSRRYYEKKYLGAGAFRLGISDLTYRIGRFDYLAADWVSSKLRGR